MEEFIPMIAAALKLPAHRVENTLKLLQGGATIPFISRYRKEATGGQNFRHTVLMLITFPSFRKE